MRTQSAVSLVMVSILGSALATVAAVDGASVSRWVATPSWIQQPPEAYALTREADGLVFTVTDAEREMVWLLQVAPGETSGEERYVLVRYRAEGLSTAPNVYFLHGQEGSHGGRAFAMADDLQPDGDWHTLAVDLMAVQPRETTHGLGVKVRSTGAGNARLTVERIWFANELPDGATVARVVQKPALRRTEVRWADMHALGPRQWTTTPARDYSSEPSADGMVFRVQGAGLGMRWLYSLPEPVDLATTPYLSLRYRARGDLGRETYAIWLGEDEGGSAGEAVIALHAQDLRCDGQWHTLQTQVKRQFAAPYLAVGLDSLGAAVEMTLGDLTFTSGPRNWRIAEVLPEVKASGPWGAGEQGFTPLPLQITGGRPSPFLRSRLELEDWFDATDLTIGGIPFHVPTDPSGLPVTSLGDFGELRLAVPAEARELYLLTAAAAPPTEPWGIDWANPRPQEMLDVPEKVYYEIQYAKGPPDQVLPLDVTTGRWGMKRGLSVNVVHPDPTREAVAVVLREGMQTASFGIVAATMLTEDPRIAEPDWKHLAYPRPPAAPLAGCRPTTAPDGEPTVNAGLLQARFATEGGLAWRDLSVSGLPEALACAESPLFEVRVEGRLLPAADWTVQKVESAGAARTFRVANPTAKLMAIIEVAPGQGNELLLRMTLANNGPNALKATIHFPVLRGVTLGHAADTWYLYGKRGGVINSAPGRWRDPLGERHPLQMDGFFNPTSGLALACLTHDTAAQHHFLNLGKNDEGGEWAPEYVDRNLAPGASFTATEAALVLREGDWRAIFGAYRDWLAAWFRPAVPRRRWFTESFAIASSNNHYDAAPDPRVRGDVQRLVDHYRQYIGLCDRVHLFGWGASKVYGDWGDYDHYEELGGLDYFRESVRKVQEQGVAVSLYLDGYLSSAKGRNVGAHAEAWAMQRPDGSPQFIPEYQAYNQCLYLKEWRDYIAAACGRVQRETGCQVLYIDEIGATDGRWICHASDHGHNAPEIPYAGEVALMKAIREAVDPSVALYTEYAPAEVTRQYQDGSISYQALWSVDMEPLAPHFIDLPRFAFPDFKQFHIIYNVPTRAGNWWLLKFPFFNGEVYRLGEPNLPGMDAPSLAFQKRAIEVQCAHREAFGSDDVEPLVETLQPGVFANRFSTARETVWTLYNANGRGVRGGVLRVKHAPGAEYEDAWRGERLQPRITGDTAEIALELGPKAVGCVVQRRR
ncbi:MAG: hypothetical protein HPY69_18805 [Armatimonadetes bacterium]|nr:hypothetical protein [Armatimonadota bacterium]